MQNDIDPQTPTPAPGHNKGKVIAGFVLLSIGGLLLLQQLAGFAFPWWIFSWPMYLVIIGLYIGARHNFQKPSAYIMVIVGLAFLADEILPDANVRHMFWPVIIIAAGVLLILNRNHQWDTGRFKRKHRWKRSQTWEENQQYAWDKKVADPADPSAPLSDDPSSAPYSNTNYTQSGKTYKGYPVEDYLDATSIFGSATKTIFTKTFRGGEIVNIFGGAEIDFTQSDIQGQVVIDVTQIFGGIKLLVPPHWHVTSDTVSLFAGFDDKRKMRNNLAADKILMITGTSIFAGIEIRSY